MISASVLAGMMLATTQMTITAHADSSPTTASSTDEGSQSGTTDSTNTGSDVKPTDSSNSTAIASSAGSDNGSDDTNSTTATTKAAKLTVVKNNDPSVKIDNQLKISTDKAATLKSVTPSNKNNSALDDATHTVTITDPVATDTVTAKYGNVGTYQGKAVSAEVTVANMIKHTEDHIAPSSLASNVVQVMFDPSFGGGISTYNIAQDEITIKFFDAQGQQLNIDGNGYLTVGSLNGPSVNTAGNEYVNYDNSKNATYVTENSVVKYETNPVTGNGNAYVGTSSNFTDELGAPTSEDGAVTFQLNGNSFKFINGTTRYSLKSKSHHWSYALTTFSSATIAPAVLPAPILAVDKSSAKAGDTVTYTLKQTVNTLGEDTMLRYQSWSEAVTLPSEVTYQSGSLLDMTGKTISDASVNYDKAKHTVTVTLPASYLGSGMALNGETYTIKLVTKVNNNVANGEVGTGSGQTTVDKNAQSSNTVDTTYVAPYYQVEANNLTVHYYKEGTTEKLADDEVISVKNGETYTAPSKSVKGYTVSSHVNTSGTYYGEADAVFYYTNKKGTVTVYYVMDTGGELYKESISGKVGEKYSVEAIDFNDGDKKDLMLKGARQISGVYTSENQKVTFVYQVPRVHSSTQSGMDVFTVKYADGQLKYVQIVDGEYDIEVAKNSQGLPMVSVRSLSMARENATLYLSSTGVANVGKRFGFFSTKKYSFVFERSYQSNTVKVLKINNKTGNLTVKKVYLFSESYSASSVVQELGVSQSRSFKLFWKTFLSGSIQSVYKMDRQKEINNRLELKNVISGEKLKDDSYLPQTSESKVNLSIYGYITLLLISFTTLFKKGRKQS